MLVQNPKMNLELTSHLRNSNLQVTRQKMMKNWLFPPRVLRHYGKNQKQYDKTISECFLWRGSRRHKKGSSKVQTLLGWNECT